MRGEKKEDLNVSVNGQIEITFSFTCYPALILSSSVLEWKEGGQNKKHNHEPQTHLIVKS